jgi:hypothetical protein
MMKMLTTIDGRRRMNGCLCFWQKNATKNIQAGKKKMTFSNIVTLVVMAMVTNVLSLPVRQIGQVVSAICAPANGTSFCVAGFVANETETKTHATALKVIGSWKFADQQPVADLTPDKSEEPLICTPNSLQCIRNGAFGSFGNYSFVIEFRMRSNGSYEHQLLGSGHWSMLMTPGGTLQFKYRVHLPDQDRDMSREFKVDSHKVINDDQWHTVRFTRSGVSEFAFSFDGVQENNITIEVPSGNVVDISDPYSAFFTGIIISNWTPIPKSPTGTMFDTVSISIGEYIATDLFSFDTATGGNVMIGDFLVDKFGCARNTTLCQSCSFCNQKYEKTTQAPVFDAWDNRYVTLREQVSRAACPAKMFFVPRHEGACCGYCFHPSEPIKFCKYQSCMRDSISAHECKECGIANAEIQCAREQSAECGAQTEAFCKLGPRIKPCACDGKIAKLPPSALVCSNKTQDYGTQCIPQPDGSIKVVKSMREYVECAGSNGRSFELDINRTQCLNFEPDRKRKGAFFPCSETNTTTETNTTMTLTSGAANQRTWGIIVFTLISVAVSLAK